MIIDDKWITIGSANANPRSFRVDSEVNILVRDNDFARTVRKKLWLEHLQVLQEDLERVGKDKDISTPLSLWKKIATKKYRLIKTKKFPNSRILEHVPVKGKKIDLAQYGISWWERRVLPDIDILAQRSVSEVERRA